MLPIMNRTRGGNVPGSETNAQFKTKGNTSGSFKAGTNNYLLLINLIINFGAGQLGLEHRFFAG